MDIRSWIMDKSITESNKIYESYLTRLFSYVSSTITLTPYIVLPLFATRFADYAGGIRVSFIQPRLF